MLVVLIPFNSFLAASDTKQTISPAIIDVAFTQVDSLCSPLSSVLIYTANSVISSDGVYGLLTKVGAVVVSVTALVLHPAKVQPWLPQRSEGEASGSSTLLPVNEFMQEPVPASKVTVCCAAKRASRALLVAALKLYSAVVATIPLLSYQPIKS